MAKRRRSSVSSTHISDYEHSDAEGSDYGETLPKRKKKATVGRKQPKPKYTTADTALSGTEVKQQGDALPHPASSHVIRSPGPIRVALLRWYAGVHASRGMPWRKPFDPLQGPEERAQRAYEVLTVGHYSMAMS